MNSRGKCGWSWKKGELAKIGRQDNVWFEGKIKLENAYTVSTIISNRDWLLNKT